jgi:hypothetical protein
MDVALAGKTGIIERFEQDYEGRIRIATMVAEQPLQNIAQAPLRGRDQGRRNRLPHLCFIAGRSRKAAGGR